MKPRLLLAFSLLAAAIDSSVFAQPADASATDQRPFASGIVAVAEDKIITVTDVMREVAPVLQGIGRTARTEKEYADAVEAEYDRTIQDLADRVLIIKEFRKDDKRQIPASYIDNAIADELADRFEGNRSKQLAYLHAQGKSQRDYRRDVEESIIYQYMQGQKRKSQSVVSPVRIENYYNENKDQFYQADEIHLRIIQLNRGEGATNATLTEKAREILARFRTGVAFEDLAREFSDAARSKGGDWGWAPIANLNPSFRDAAVVMKKGDVSAPILLPDACYLVFAENRKDAGIKPIDDVRDQIERILTAQMANAHHERYLERLRRNGYVKFY